MFDSADVVDVSEAEARVLAGDSSILDSVTGAPFTHVATRYAATWFSAEDPQSACAYRVHLIGDNLPAGPPFGWAAGLGSGGTPVGSAREFQWNGLSLRQGGWYRVRVQATNAAGLSTFVTSRGWVVDVTPPTGGFVADGIAFSVDDDTDYQDADSLFLEASWGDWSDDVSGTCGSRRPGFSQPLCVHKADLVRCVAGVVKYAWTVRAEPASRNATYGEGDTWLGAKSSHRASLLFDWTDVDLNTTAFVDGAVLRAGIRYRVCLRVYNGAGLFTQVESDGVIIDAADPCLHGVVPGTDVNESPAGLTSSTAIDASWRALLDPDLPSTKAACNRTAEGVIDGTINATTLEHVLPAAPVAFFEWQLDRLSPLNQTNLTGVLAGYNNTVVEETVNGTTRLINRRTAVNNTNTTLSSPDLDPVDGFRTVVVEYEHVGPVHAAPTGECCTQWDVTPKVAHPDFMWAPLLTTPGFADGDVGVIGVRLRPVAS